MPLKTVVRCYFKTFGDFVSTYSSDVSRGGLFISTNEPVADGEQLRIEFKLRNDYPLIMGEGEVVSVQAGGFIANFTRLDADSEKFLNEVVRVKAAELKLDPAAPKPGFDVKVSQEDVAGTDGDEFEDAFEQIEEIEEVEPTETGADPFEEDIFAESPAAPEADFSGMQLNAEEPEEIGDPLGDEPAEIADPFGDDPSAEFEDTSGYEDVEAVEPPSMELDDDGFEPVEQSPANPQALFDDIPADDGVPYGASEPGEQTVGGGTTIFERLSTLKERRALLIGVGVGVLLLALGGGAYFFLGGSQPQVASAPAPGPSTVAQVMPAATTAAAADSTSPVAVAVAATAVTLPKPVAVAPTPAPAAVQPAAAPAAAAKPAAAVAAPAVAPNAAVKQKVAAVKTGPAKHVTSIESFADRVEIIGDGGFGKVKHFAMGEPNRIVVDIYGVDKTFRGNRDGKGKVARIRPGVHKTKVRFVLDLAKEKGRVPAYSIDKEGDRVIVRFQ